jgi:hypothetical protein
MFFIKITINATGYVKKRFAIGDAFLRRPDQERDRSDTRKKSRALKSTPPIVSSLG